jgi:hypothetical protein
LFWLLDFGFARVEFGMIVEVAAENAMWCKRKDKSLGPEGNYQLPHHKRSTFVGEVVSGMPLLVQLSLSPLQR